MIRALLAASASLFRSRAELILENIALRQQIAVLQRKTSKADAAPLATSSESFSADSSPDGAMLLS